MNVFLGLGLPWVFASLYYQNQDPPINYKVPSKGLDLSVALFLCCSVVAVLIMTGRRICLKGELGGSKSGRMVSAIAYVMLWLTYIVVSSLAQYEYIKF